MLTAEEARRRLVIARGEGKRLSHARDLRLDEARRLLGLTWTPQPPSVGERKSILDCRVSVSPARRSGRR